MTQHIDPEISAPAPEMADSSQGIPLLITKRQRAELSARGFSDEGIRAMTPTEAHQHLGSRTASVQTETG